METQRSLDITVYTSLVFLHLSTPPHIGGLLLFFGNEILISQCKDIVDTQQAAT